MSQTEDFITHDPTGARYGNSQTLPAKVAFVTANSFQSGDVVALKSGGPAMTVIECSPNWAYVTWHKDDGNDVLKDWLPLRCLEKKK